MKILGTKFTRTDFEGRKFSPEEDSWEKRTNGPQRIVASNGESGKQELRLGTVSPGGPAKIDSQQRKERESGRPRLGGLWPIAGPKSKNSHRTGKRPHCAKKGGSIRGRMSTIHVTDAWKGNNDLLSLNH